MAVEVAALAGAAVAFLGDKLLEAGKDLAGKAIGAGSEKLLGWLKKTLTGASKTAALAEFQAEPGSEASRDMLAAAILSQLKQQPALAKELAALLREAGAPVPGVTQSTTQIGDGNQSAQIVGESNKVKFR